MNPNYDPNPNYNGGPNANSLSLTPDEVDTLNSQANPNQGKNTSNYATYFDKVVPDYQSSVNELYPHGYTGPQPGMQPTRPADAKNNAAFNAGTYQLGPQDGVLNPLEQQLSPMQRISLQWKRESNNALGDIPAYKKGGMVKKTGPAIVHKGEYVLTKAKTDALKKKKGNSKK